jgi:hypothetical protein
MIPYVKKRKPIPIVDVQEPDWSKMLYALKARSHSAAGVMRAAGMGKDHYYSILNGLSQPQWYAGEVIRRLYEANV